MVDGSEARCEEMDASDVAVIGKGDAVQCSADGDTICRKIMRFCQYSSGIAHSRLRRWKGRSGTSETAEVDFPSATLGLWEGR